MKKLLVIALLALSSASHADTKHHIDGLFSISLAGDWKTRIADQVEIDKATSQSTPTRVFAAVRKHKGRVQILLVDVQKSSKSESDLEKMPAGLVLDIAAKISDRGKEITESEGHTDVSAYGSIGAFMGNFATVIDTRYTQADGRPVSMAEFHIDRSDGSYDVIIKEVGTHESLDARAILDAISAFTFLSEI